MKRNNCRFCHKNIDGIFCANCGCITPNKKNKLSVNINETFTDYCYNQYQQSFLQKIYWSWLKFTVALFINNNFYTTVLNWLLSPLTGGKPSLRFKRSESLIDVGCGRGDFINCLPKRWKVNGYEIVKYQNLPKNVYVGNFEASSLKNKYSIVRSSHSLEHSLHPKLFLDKMMSITDKNGNLIVLSPNSNSLSYKIFGTRWAPLNIDSHFCILSMGCVRKYLEEKGFKIISSKTYTIFQSVGSVMDYLKIKKFSFFFFVLFSIILLPLTFLEVALNRGDSFVIYAKKI